MLKDCIFFHGTKCTSVDHFLFPEDWRDSSSDALDEPIVDASICSCTESPRR